MEDQVRVRESERGSGCLRADYKVRVADHKYRAVRDHHEAKGAVLVSQSRVESLGEVVMYFREEK